MASALISRTPQRLISILEGAHEDRSSSLTSSEGSRDADGRQGTLAQKRQKPSSRLKQILDVPTFEREQEMGRANSPTMNQAVSHATADMVPEAGATDEVVDKFAAALALNEIAKAKARIPQALVRPALIVGRGQDAEYASVRDALKSVRRGREVVLYLTEELYRETAPLQVSGDVRLQPDPGSTTRPRIQLVDGTVGIQLMESSATFHAIGLSFEQMAPAKVGVKPMQVERKALVHPPVRGHSVDLPGFGHASALQARCFQAERGILRLEQCAVRSVAGDGVVVGGSGRLHLRGGTVQGCGGHGVAVADGGVVSASEAVLQGNQRCGFVVHGAGSSAQIEGCTVQQNTCSGVVVDGGGSARVQGGSLSGNGHAGLHVQAAGSTAHVSTCAVGRNAKHGVSVDSSGRGRQEGRVRGEADPWLQMRGQGEAEPRARRAREGGPRASVSSCQLKGNGRCGVRVRGMLAACEVRDCRVEESGAEGLAARGGGQVVGSGSQLAQNRGGGALAEGRGAAVHLSQCTVVGGDYGVVAREGEVKLHRCRVAMNLRADREQRGAGRVEDVREGEGDEQWVANTDGRPPTMMKPPPWLADMPKSNTLRTWHGY